MSCCGSGDPKRHTRSSFQPALRNSSTNCPSVRSWQFNMPIICHRRKKSLVSPKFFILADRRSTHQHVHAVQVPHRRVSMRKQRRGLSVPRRTRHVRHLRRGVAA